MTESLELRARVAGAPISWGVSEVPGWGWQAPPRRVLGEMRALGLRATELGPPGFLPANPEALGALLKEFGLRLVGGFLAVELHSPAAAERAPASISAAARTIEEAGGELLVLAAGGAGAGYARREVLDREAWRRMAGLLAAARHVARERGLALAVHPHMGTLIEGPGEVAALLELTDADLCLDSGHLAVAGVDPAELAERAAGRVRLVHLKDVDLDLAARVREGTLPYPEAVAQGLYRPLGEGGVDLGGLVRRLEAGGYGGWYVLEQDVMLSAEPEPGSGPAADVERSLGWFARLADGYQGGLRTRR